MRGERERDGWMTESVRSISERINSERERYERYEKGGGGDQGWGTDAVGSERDNLSWLIPVGRMIHTHTQGRTHSHRLKSLDLI